VETQDSHNVRSCCSRNSYLFHKALLHDEIKICALSASIVIAYVFFEVKKKFQPLCLFSSLTPFFKVLIEEKNLQLLCGGQCQEISQ